MSGVKGKVVMVTGGSKGIGAAAVRQFILEGAKYAAILDIDDKAGMSLQNELTKESGAKVKFINCDVTSDDDLTAAYEEVLKDNGQIDIVINSAGIANETKDMYKKLIAINFTAAITSTFKAIDLMHKDRSGKGGIIINISSISALLQAPYLPVYFSTKSGILQFSNCIGAKENYEKTGVKVMAICYGATDTEIMTPENLKPYHEHNRTAEFNDFVNSYFRQRTDLAAKSLIEICCRGDSGTTWLSRNDLPVEDITPTVKEAYNLLGGTIPSK